MLHVVSLPHRLVQRRAAGEQATVCQKELAGAVGAGQWASVQALADSACERVWCARRPASGERSARTAAAAGRAGWAGPAWCAARPDLCQGALQSTAGRSGYQGAARGTQPMRPLFAARVCAPTCVLRSGEPGCAQQRPVRCGGKARPGWSAIVTRLPRRRRRRVCAGVGAAGAAAFRRRAARRAAWCAQRLPRAPQRQRGASRRGPGRGGPAWRAPRRAQRLPGPRRQRRVAGRATGPRRGRVPAALPWRRRARRIWRRAAARRALPSPGVKTSGCAGWSGRTCAPGRTCTPGRVLHQMSACKPFPATRPA